MKKVLLALLLSAVPAIADTDGVQILPFTTPGGGVTGFLVVESDGSATVQGFIGPAPFMGRGKVVRDGDGVYCFEGLLTDADLMIRHKLWLPIYLKFWGTKEDAADGDDTDDSVGSIEVKSQTGVGKGSVQLSG